MLNLRGHSRFKTELIESNGVQLVKKSAPSFDLYRRLFKQIERQQASKSIYSRFKVPKIIEVNEPGRFVTMEYIDKLSPIQFLCFFPEKSTWFFSEIVGYFNHLIDKCEFRDFDKHLFQDKIQSTFTNILLDKVEDAETTRRIREITKQLIGKTEEMSGALDYITPVHGDFTLSNILVGDETIYWLDFMDGWNHSVMIDFAKIYQEIRYCWSARFVNSQNIRYQSYGKLLSELLNEMELGFFASGKDNQLLNAYRVLNDMRLLQYEKNQWWVNEILTSIERRVKCI